MPDYIADPRLSRLSFTQLKRCVKEGTEDGSVHRAADGATTKFALATLAEDNAISLETILSTAPPPSERSQRSFTSAMKTAQCSAATAALETSCSSSNGDGNDSAASRGVAALLAERDAQVVATASRAAEALQAAEDASRLAASTSASAEAAMRELEA
jgi:hypothetical protein